ncbi:UPF0481 protein At3g47200-like [Cornus florida]|uniref:UPF0481 protein At3g47200-like n=1 Tax=Cornus florida TaxID=4283 RepID=UPI00289F5C8A|nr:UPF0481 protein At3g47200-like [Cornus florida]
MEEPSMNREVPIGNEAHRGSSNGSCRNELISINVINPDASASHSCSRNDDELLRSMVNGADRKFKNKKRQKPKIQKVPLMLREIESNKKCYDPLVVSIGPYHHGKPELAPTEELKILLANQFADKSKATISDLYRKVAEMVNEDRNCYAEGSTDGFDDEAFALMMFLDGCFILQFIYCIVYGQSKDLMMKSHDIAFVRRDFFLFENQLPFAVLKLLMSMRFETVEGEEMINRFIWRSRPEHPHESRAAQGSLEAKEKIRPEQQPSHLLELVRTQHIDVGAFNQGGCYLKGEWWSYRSAMELKQVGIYCRPSNTRRFSDITFKPNRGFSARLMLPSVTIDDSSKSLFLNLVAYEACPDTPDDFGVTSYICFMDSLIDHAEDVKELRSKGILLNFLGSDQQVADLFNEIATNLVPNPHGFVGAKQSIEDHYKSNIKVWMAEWRHMHFSTPWTIIAFVVAIIVINLGVLQTILAAFQTYLTAYPPKK